MSKKLYVQAITPSVEIAVKPAGSSEKEVTFGFKVLGLKQRKALAEKYESNRVSYTKLMGELTELEASTKVKEAAGETLSTEERKAIADLMEKLYKEIAILEELNVQLVSEDILYIKNATARDFDELGNVCFEELVADTRVAKSTDYWATPTECLQLFIEAFLDSKVWLEAIKLAHQEAMEKDFKDLQVKN